MAGRDSYRPNPSEQKFISRVKLFKTRLDCGTLTFLARHMSLTLTLNSSHSRTIGAIHSTPIAYSLSRVVTSTWLLLG